MNAHKRDSALSEVVGMILIIAIIVTMLSVYLTYIVPERGKGGEILHTAEVRGSFLELTYLVNSLWVNGKTDVSVAVPISLHSAFEPAIIPLFTPVSSQGSLMITDETGTCTITLQGFAEKHVFMPFDDVTLHNETKTLNGTPQSIIFHFTQNISPNTPTQGIIGELKGEDWHIDFKIQNVLTNVAVNEIANVTITDPDNPSSIAKEYVHSLIAVEKESMLEYVVIAQLSDEPVSVDVKPVLDLFLGDRLLSGSSLSFFPSSEPLFINSTSHITVSYGPSFSEYNPFSFPTVSVSTPLTDLRFVSSHYYWIDQEYRYQKGGVFLLQGESSTSLVDVPLHFETAADGSREISFVDIAIHPRDNRLQSSGGRAQIIAEIRDIGNQLCDEVRCYDASNGVALTAEFRVSSDNESTIQMWKSVLGKECEKLESACTLATHNPKQIILSVVADSVHEPLTIRYTNVAIDMEIRA